MNLPSQHVRQLERETLGAALHSSESADKMFAILRDPEAFSVHAHRVVYSAIGRLRKAGQPVDASAVYGECIRTGEEKELGSVIFLADLLTEATSVDPTHKLNEIRDAWLRRQLRESLKEASRAAADPSIDLSEILQRQHALMAELSSRRAAIDDDKADTGNGWKPFPLEALPETMARYVESAAKALDCEPAFIAVPSLVAVASCIGCSRVAHVKDSWMEPSILWATVIADSSSRKSPALDLALAPINSIQHSLSKGFDEAYRFYQRQYEEWMGQRYQPKRDGGKDDDSPQSGPPRMPARQKLIVKNITIEMLATILSENPKGLVLATDELATWFGSFSRYKDKGGGSDLPHWLEAFGGRSWLIDRKTGNPPQVYVPRASVSVVGGIQPATIARCLDEAATEAGLASRILFCMPPGRVKAWNEDVMDQSVFDDHVQICKWLYYEAEEYNVPEEVTPKAVKKTTAGHARWKLFFDQWAERQATSTGETLYAMSKLEGICARLALLLSCYEKREISSRKELITESHVERAQMMVEWFAHEAERVYGMLRKPSKQRKQEKILEFITTLGGEITARRLFRSNPAHYGTPEKAGVFLETLAKEGYGNIQMKRHGEAGGRPTKVFCVLPAKTQTSQN